MLGSTGPLSPSHLGSSQWLRYVGAWLAAVPGGTVAWSLLTASVDAPGGFLAHACAGLLLSRSLTLASWRPSATHQPAL